MALRVGRILKIALDLSYLPSLRTICLEFGFDIEPMYTIWHRFEFEDSKAGIWKLFVLSIPPPLPPLPSLIPPPSLPSPPSLPLPQLAADGAGGGQDQTAAEHGNGDTEGCGLRPFRKYLWHLGQNL